MKTPLLKKLKLCYRYFNVIDKTVAIDLYNEDLLKASLKKSLSKYGYMSPYNDVVMEDIVDSAIQSAKGLSERTHIEKVAEAFAPVMDGIAHKVALTGGLACLWELELKFFASKLTEIKVFEVTRNKQKLRTSNVADIAKPLNQYYPYISCDLSYVAELRNNLFHGNFHQLKTELLKKISPEHRKDLDAKIAVIHAGHPESKVVMAHEVTDLEDAREMGLFLWFMSAGNSKLLDHVINELTKSIRDLQILTDLHAHSFDETKGFFNQMAKEGKILSSKQIDIYFEERKKGLSQEHRAEFIRDLNSVFRFDQ